MAEPDPSEGFVRRTRRDVRRVAREHPLVSILTVAVGLGTTAAGTWIEGWEEALLTAYLALGGWVGLVLVQCVRAPFRQRDEARAALRQRFRIDLSFPEQVEEGDIVFTVRNAGPADNFSINAKLLSISGWEEQRFFRPSWVETNERMVRLNREDRASFVLAHCEFLGLSHDGKNNRLTVLEATASGRKSVGEMTWGKVGPKQEDWPAATVWIGVSCESGDTYRATYALIGTPIGTVDVIDIAVEDPIGL